MFKDRIKAKYEDMSPSFRRLADFVLHQQLDAAFMTATELAQSLDVDAATVVRFAQLLGYSGFRELIKEVQQVVKQELAAPQTGALDAPDDVALIQGLLENERHNLELCRTQLTEQANDILPDLLNARRVWITGQGLGTHLASLFAAALRDIDLPAAAFAPGPLDAARSLSDIGGDDLVIGLSLSGAELSVGDAIRFAHQRGAKTIALSTSPVTAAALAAEATIVCPGPTQTHIDSFTALAAMIIVLVQALTARSSPERATERATALQQGYRELMEIQAHSSSETDVESLWRQF